MDLRVFSGSTVAPVLGQESSLVIEIVSSTPHQPKWTKDGISSDDYISRHRGPDDGLAPGSEQHIGLTPPPGNQPVGLPCRKEDHAGFRGRGSPRKILIGSRSCSKLDQMDPISPGVAGNAIWTGISNTPRAVFGGDIEITSPRTGEILSGQEALGDGFSYQVRGKLKRLPKGHEIWLLTQDESTGMLWPQGFFPVHFDSREKTWMGKINGSGKKQVKIVAVAAPPTSQDLFRYFQLLGRMLEYKFEPLKRVPAECRNVTSVQALLP